MNKTVTINISGIIFHIEEDAYETLSRYLVTIKGYFSSTDGGAEIMADIEARIAELLQQKINASKQVILMSDVEYVMGIMGRPEDFSDSATNEEAGKTQATIDPEQRRMTRRLFRDPDQKAIGGVCSGLAAYFDIDTVWVRLAMFLLIFFGGLSLWVYIILWIVIPQAKTTADKFAMRGEPANINNIFRSFKEEAGDVKNRFSKYGSELNTNYGEAVRGNISSALNTVFNIIGRLIGVFLIIFGAILLFAYVASLMGISVIGDNADISNWKAMIFPSASDYMLAVISFLLVIGIPIFMLLYVGVKLLFKIRYSNRWLNLGLGLLWLLGFIAGCYVVASTVKHFQETSRVKETLVMRGLSDTVVVKLNPAKNVLVGKHYDNMDDVESATGRRKGYRIAADGSKLQLVGRAELDVVESKSDSIELEVIYISKGVSKKDANENARSITYKFKKDENNLVFDEIFFVTENTKFRNQEVELRLGLPVGKVVYFDKSVKYFLDDVDNTSNTWDGDMVGRRWVMTAKGLSCIDCDDLPKHRSADHFKKKRGSKIRIDDEGIRVNDEDGTIEIDDDGIRIQSHEGDEEEVSEGTSTPEKKREEKQARKKREPRSEH